MSYLLLVPSNVYARKPKSPEQHRTPGHIPSPQRPEATTSTHVCADGNLLCLGLQMSYLTNTLTFLHGSRSNVVLTGMESYSQSRRRKGSVLRNHGRKSSKVFTTKNLRLNFKQEAAVSLAEIREQSFRTAAILIISLKVMALGVRAQHSP